MIKKHQRVLQMVNIIFPLVAALLFLLRFGFGMEQIRSMVFLLLLLYAANSDLNSAEVPDKIPVMIIITSFINIQVDEIPFMLAGAVVVTVPQLIAAMRNPEGWGGGDIKMVFASVFLLGVWKGFFAVIVAVSIALLVTITLKRLYHKNNSFRFMPYLGTACLIAYLL